METFKEIVAYITMHGPALLAAGTSLWAFLEVIVRLTPTEKDDTALERVGKIIRRVMDIFMPNLKKGGGQHPTLVEKEKA